MDRSLPCQRKSKGRPSALLVGYGKECIQESFLLVLFRPAMLLQFLRKSNEWILSKFCRQNPPHGMFRIGRRDKNVSNLFFQSCLHTFKIPIGQTDLLTLSKATVIVARQVLS